MLALAIDFTEIIEPCVTPDPVIAPDLLSVGRKDTGRNLIFRIVNYRVHIKGDVLPFLVCLAQVVYDRVFQRRDQAAVARSRVH